MRILTRYIVSDLLKIFLLTLVSMTVFVFLVLVGKEAVENGLGLVPILQMVPYILPQAMQFAVPGTMLLATTSVYGRIASANEVVAIKSLGISPMVLIWPTLILATVVSFTAVILNDVAVSWGRGGVERVILGSAEEIAYGRLRTKRTFSNDNVNVTVRRVEDKRLIQPTVLIFDSNRNSPVTITADEAEIHADFQKQAIIIKFTNADVVAGESFAISHPGVLEWPVSLAAFSGRGEGKRSPSNYSLREIGPSKTLQWDEIGRLKQEMTADAAFALMTGRTYELSQTVWQERERQLWGAQETLNRLYTEPHRRWANGFSCLCFVMIGAPMSIRRRHAEFWGTFFMCFVPILLVYYPMLVGTVDYAKDGIFPSHAVWLGNLVLAGWGVWLMQRVIKY